MKRYLIGLSFVFLCAACGPTPTVTPFASTPDVPATTLIEPTAVPVQPTDAPSMNAQSTATAQAAPVESAPLALQVFSPQDEAVVDAPQVDVVGSVAAGAVVSVNDAILIVGADGQFRVTVPLEEGPNLIEVVASNDNGDEASVILTVTYEP